MQYSAFLVEYLIVIKNNMFNNLIIGFLTLFSVIHISVLFFDSAVYLPHSFIVLMNWTLIVVKMKVSENEYKGI